MHFMAEWIIPEYAKAGHSPYTDRLEVACDFPAPPRPYDCETTERVGLPVSTEISRSSLSMTQ